MFWKEESGEEVINVFTEEELRRQILKVHIQKTAGPDKVSPTVLRSCADHLAKLLRIIFSFQTALLTYSRKLDANASAEVRSVLELNDLRPVVMTVFESLYSNAY